MVFASITAQFIFIAHFILFIKFKHRGLLRVCAITFFQKLLGEILKRAYEESRPREACLFNNAPSLGNPSELSAVATAYFIGHLYTAIHNSKLFQTKTLLINVANFIYLMLVLQSRVYLYYNSQDQVTYGVIQGISITITAFMFLIGPSQDCTFAEFFADYDETNVMSAESIKLMQELCAKLGVDPSLEPTQKAKEIIKKMESLEQLKSQLSQENTQAQQRMGKLEKQASQREAAQKQMEQVMQSMTASQMLGQVNRQQEQHQLNGHNSKINGHHKQE
eukprot:403365280